MKITIKTVRYNEDLKKSQNPLRQELAGYVDELIANSVTGTVKASDKQGQMIFDKVNNKSSDIITYKLFLNENMVEVSDFPMWIYAPKAFLETNVFTGLRGATALDEDENEVPVKWKNWSATPHYDIPLKENDTHVILSLQTFGECLTEAEAAIIASKEESEGIELLSTIEYLAKLPLFETEE